MAFIDNQSWLDRAPLRPICDRVRGEGVALDLSISVYPGGFTTFGYQRQGIWSIEMQILNTYEEAERVFRAIWERARQRAQQPTPRVTGEL